MNYGEDIEAGARVELSPHLDFWMRGAKYGTVLSVKDGVARVELDHPEVRLPIGILVVDLKRTHVGQGAGIVAAISSRLDISKGLTDNPWPAAPEERRGGYPKTDILRDLPEEVVADLRSVVLGDEIRHVQDRVLTGLGVPRGFVEGDTTFSSQKYMLEGTMGIIDDLFTYHQPTEETKPRYSAIRAAERKAHDVGRRAIEAVNTLHVAAKTLPKDERPNPLVPVEELQPRYTEVRESCRAFYESVLEQYQAMVNQLPDGLKHTIGCEPYSCFTGALQHIILASSEACEAISRGAKWSSEPAQAFRSHLRAARLLVNKGIAVGFTQGGK